VNATRKRILLKSLLVVLAVLSVPIVVLASGVIPPWNDFFCGSVEKRAMSEFPHLTGVEPEWKSNAKVTGGCTTTFTVDGSPDDARTHYEDHLSRNGWSVEPGPVNTLPIYLEADRDDLGYFLMFEGPDTSGPLAQEQVENEKNVQAQDGENQRQQEPAAVEPGTTRVSIQGGRQR